MRVALLALLCAAGADGGLSLLGTTGTSIYNLYGYEPPARVAAVRFFNRNHEEVARIESDGGCSVLTDAGMVREQSRLCRAVWEIYCNKPRGCSW